MCVIRAGTNQLNHVGKIGPGTNDRNKVEQRVENHEETQQNWGGTLFQPFVPKHAAGDSREGVEQNTPDPRGRVFCFPTDHPANKRPDKER
jgi:hypothetical protein